MLEQIYKKESTTYLKTLLQDLEIFGYEQDAKQVKAELERRERETHETHG
jgi:protein involved in ribonucleotide reduction